MIFRVPVKIYQCLIYANNIIVSCCVDTIQSNDNDNVINDELFSVNNWLESNKLSLNINISKYIPIHIAPKHVPHLHVQINNIQ